MELKKIKQGTASGGCKHVAWLALGGLVAIMTVGCQDKMESTATDAVEPKAAAAEAKLVEMKASAEPGAKPEMDPSMKPGSPEAMKMEAEKMEAMKMEAKKMEAMKMDAKKMAGEGQDMAKKMAAEGESAAKKAVAAAPVKKTTKSVAKKATAQVAKPAVKKVTASKPVEVKKAAAVAAAPKAEEAKKPAAPAFTGTPCRQKAFKFSAVRSACQKGGVKQAKSLMKYWTKKAKEKTGKRYKCSACHSSTKTYVNKPNAASDLNAMLKASK